MKLSPEENFWSDLLDFVGKKMKPMRVVKFDGSNTYNVATRLQIEFIEATKEAALNIILDKCRIEKLTDSELRFLRETLILTLKENSQLKSDKKLFLLNSR